MRNDKEPQVVSSDASLKAPVEASRRGEASEKPVAATEARSASERVLGGLERIREILLGDILAELERRLARIDNQLANRTTELQQDARHRTDVLDAHVRKEIDALSARAAHDNTEVSESLRAFRTEERGAIAQVEQRLGQLEAKLDAAVARVEHDIRQQLLDQAKSFLNELERVRRQLRSSLVRELGLEPAPLEEGIDHAGGAWVAPH